MQSTDSTTSSTDGTSQVTTLRPRPALPKQRLTAQPIPHDLDMAWDDGPILPPFPGQRRSPEAPQPKTPAPRTPSDLILRVGEHAANSCFDGAA